MPLVPMSIPRFSCEKGIYWKSWERLPAWGIVVGKWWSTFIQPKCSPLWPYFFHTCFFICLSVPIYPLSLALSLVLSLSRSHSVKFIWPSSHKNIFDLCLYYNSWKSHLPWERLAPAMFEVWKMQEDFKCRWPCRGKWTTWRDACSWQWLEEQFCPVS